MSLNEFAIIEKFFVPQKINREDVQLGIGDDAALVTIPTNHELVVTTDTLISGTHFFADAKPFDIGYKALTVNLSDLAAMGATPTWVTLALTLPEADESWLAELMRGFFNLANQYQVQLIGGDLTRGNLSITIQAMGIIPKGKALRRAGAKVGDLIYVTNTLGDAAYNLKLANDSKPEPQIKIGEKLRGIANSAIDISDGFLQDLSHILKASKVGSIVWLDKIPLSPTLKRSLSIENETLKSALFGTDEMHLALNGGDDYQLCFTVPKSLTEKLSSQLKNENYTCIGEIITGSEILLEDVDGKKSSANIAGYTHF